MPLQDTFTEKESSISADVDENGVASWEQSASDVDAADTLEGLDAWIEGYHYFDGTEEILGTAHVDARPAWLTAVVASLVRGSDGVVRGTVDFTADTTQMPANLSFAVVGVSIRDTRGLTTTGHFYVWMDADPGAPEAPLNLAATAGDTQVELTWDRSGEVDVKEYRVEYKATADSTWTEWDTVAQTAEGVDPTVTVTGLTNGTSYDFRVFAIDTTGHVSSASNVATATPGSVASGYTFFRFIILANNGDATFSGIRELELRETVGGANALTSRTKTVTTSGETSGFEATEAFDDSSADSNGWVTPSGQFLCAWIQVEVNTPIDVAEYAVGAYPTTNSTAARSVAAWILEASADGVAWDILDYRSGITWTAPFTDLKSYEPQGDTLTVLVQDTFSDTDGTALPAHTPETGGAWTEHQGTWTIAGGQVTSDNAAGRATQSTVASKVIVEADFIPDASPSGGIMFNADPAFSGFRLAYNDSAGRWELADDSGVVASLTEAVTAGQTYHLRVVAYGEGVLCTLNGEAILRMQNRTNESRTYHGLYGEEALDNFVVKAL